MEFPYYPIIFVGVEPRSNLAKTHNYKFDVAISYAGEDRRYVEKVNRELVEAGVNVFYDRENQGDMVGTDLEKQLPKIYSEDSKYCLMFVSRNYISKKWSTVERESAMQRAAQEDSEYIIPVRLDSTELPGIKRSLVFLNGESVKPTAIADIVIQKLPRTKLFSRFDQSTRRIYQRPSGSLELQALSSPLKRLEEDLDYKKQHLIGSETLTKRSVFLFDEYYQFRGGSMTETWKGIVHYASILHDMILEINDRFNNDSERKTLKSSFGVYLLGHSVGGLVCRCLLQNPDVGTPKSKSLIKKLVTFGTPHRGIWDDTLSRVRSNFVADDLKDLDQRQLANLLKINHDIPFIDPIFDSIELSSYLGKLNGCFNPSNILCVVGTNRSRYPHVSSNDPGDGLVHINSASLEGAHKSFIDGSHGGEYGILRIPETIDLVEGFLFGNVYIRASLAVKDISYPPKIRKIYDEGREIKASYPFEVKLRIRGQKGIDAIHQRRVENQTAIFHPHEYLVDAPSEFLIEPQLFSLFLDTSWISNASNSLGFSLDLSVPVPVYEIDRMPWLDEYSGGFLFRDMINIEFFIDSSHYLNLKYQFDSSGMGPKHAKVQKDKYSFNSIIPIEQKAQPGLNADLKLSVMPWNT